MAGLDRLRFTDGELIDRCGTMKLTVVLAFPDKFTMNVSDQQGSFGSFSFD